MATPYKINIPMYEGPLDLLLDLIKQQKMNILDIQISKITAQYLEYLHKLEELDVDVSAEFIYMAATLIYIKSKMLLPPDPLGETEDASGDPRAELVQRWWSTRNSRMRLSFCTRNNRLKRMCGRSRTSRSITTKGLRATWWFRWSI